MLLNSEYKRSVTFCASAVNRMFQCLLLLAYLVRNGSERAVENARDHLFDLGSLENYTFTDEAGKDQGINGELIDTLQCHLN